MSGLGAYAAEDTPLVDIVGAEANERFGHIALGENGDGKPLVVFTDMGSALHLWAYTSAQLDRTAALNLSAALQRWADR